MKPSRITIKRPVDPLHREIQARLASKRAASKREPVSAPIVGQAAFYELASFVRASRVDIAVLGDR